MHKRITLPQLKKMIRENTGEEGVEFEMFGKDEAERLNSTFFPCAVIQMTAHSLEDITKEKLEASFKNFSGHVKYAFSIWEDEGEEYE